MSEQLTNAVAELREDEAIQMVKDMVAKGENPNLIFDSARKGMETVGQRFAAGEYFLPELIYSGEIFRAISEIVKPIMTAQSSQAKIGKVIVGTVAGDIHDIGKDIVVFMLDISGFEVYDLGIDVPIKNFVDKIKETKAPVVALSGFLTLAFDAMKETVEAIEAAGLRDGVKIMIGGGQIDDEIRKYTKSDAYGRDAMTAVKLAKEWFNVK
jgi:5-methyltetrahydrofolate--homocysteine methyltransferase